jgi:hypothetical protein
LAEGGLLTVPREREKELRLEARARALGIEIREEGILGLVEDERCVEPRAQPVCETRLADANRALDGNVPKITHGLAESLQDLRFCLRFAVDGRSEERESSRPGELVRVFPAFLCSSVFFCGNDSRG